jgi:hypothetical protein
VKVSFFQALRVAWGMLIILAELVREIGLAR